MAAGKKNCCFFYIFFVFRIDIKQKKSVYYNYKAGTNALKKIKLQRHSGKTGKVEIMWYVLDSNGNVVATGMSEIASRQMARRIGGKAVWDC